MIARARHLHIHVSAHVRGSRAEGQNGGGEDNWECGVFHFQLPGSGLDSSSQQRTPPGPAPGLIWRNPALANFLESVETTGVRVRVRCVGSLRVRRHRFAGTPDLSCAMNVAQRSIAQTL
jgi:hypothetical protein